MSGGGTQTGHVMTLANSIIGVAILSMPFCFQKCGILLSIVLLVTINICTRVCCHYLIKSSILCRRRSMEIIALHVFGPSGKLMVELCTIGYLMGTCVAYFVVVGDLGPQIVSKTLDIAHTDTLRVWIMLLVTAICVVPLGLLKNVDSLSVVCTASIGFYFCLVVKVMAEAREQIITGEWLDNVHLWRWSGVLQCLPIFSLSLSCQIVIFEVYESVSNATLGRMNDIVKSAISMCTCVYVAVGFFGYVAFYKLEFSGNILLNLQPSMTSDVIQMGFVISVACSFPLVIFPCRASLYSLLYQRDHSEVAQYIPEHRFRFITLSIIGLALIIGILTPSIELIIGLVGSTIGVAICIMFPASCFIKLGKRDSAELLLAKFLLVFGFFLMVLGTYANLAAIEDRTTGMQPSSGEHVHNPVAAILLATNRPPGGEHETAAPEVLVRIVPLENVTPEQPPNVAVKLDGILNVRLDEVVKKPIPAKSAKPHEPDLNREAIANEEHEIAVEAKDSIDEQLGEIKKTKELVQEIKDELAKHNEKTQQLVLDKFEEIVGKVEHIEMVQEQAVAKNQAIELEKEKNEIENGEKVAEIAANVAAKPEVMAASPAVQSAAVPAQPGPRKQPPNAIDTEDPIVNMIKKSVKARVEARNADRPPDVVQPTSTSSPLPVEKLVDNVQEIALHSANESDNATAEQRVGRDLLALH